MADALDNEKEDEYEFTGEEEYTPSDFGETGDVGGPAVDFSAERDLGSSTGMEDIIQQPSVLRKYMGIAGVGVGVVLVALFLNYRESGVSDAQEGVAPTTTTFKQQPVKATPRPVVAQPAPRPTPVVASSATLSGQDTQQLQAFGQQIRSNQLSIDNISVRVQNLETTVGKMDNTLTRIDNRLKKPQRAQRNVVKKRMVKKNKKVRRAAPVRRDLVGLKAVVPGRAWVQTSSGQMMSVRVGDSIYGLGRVKAIDAPAGKVVTSSGAVIGYGPGDF